MNALLLIDFGSTYTKLTAVDIDNEEIISSSKSLTTVDTDIMIGFRNAYRTIEEKCKGKNVQFNEKLACSSAAGGLKMVAIGLVPDLTAEAAKRAALGAGSRILQVYSHQLTLREVRDIIQKKPDIILLAGGTDGGDKDCITYNAKMIAMNIKDVPVVVAGNKNASDDIEEMFESQGVYYRIVDNVMPKLNILNVDPARDAIREIFMKKIVEAKGMRGAEEYINGILMPTPAAVLNAAKVLADGTDTEEGIGDLVVVDIGGATTDIHSIADGEPTRAGVMLTGLQEPYVKRTVEGDLGMRVSAESLWQAVATRKIKKYAPDLKYNVEERCHYLAQNVSEVPQNYDEIEFDEALSMVATEVAMERHVGKIEDVYTPMGKIYTQVGKDLLNVKYLIGTGGVLAYSKNPEKILKAGLFSEDNPKYLKPIEPKLLIDRSYILSVMGLMAVKYPDKAIRMMKKYLINLQ
ncbi:methylaspartate mutase accessory protein GlmL [Proteiniborus sp. MB09-C3]|uniref:methylaspartate mutase accessory protein GlmL n=1 Tax=Proteiniborus sp. MB09-C3 TaxID=3050072 RepID=UPI002552130A|nr:methylaspartate mutase accessory protein GlmL [Proteiniborus sp. MB09-C3]WIV10477.1 methylaspartate mutase accessory protein GlmL [Proteiniborus sp. MB09-C3]